METFCFRLQGPSQLNQYFNIEKICSKLAPMSHHIKVRLSPALSWYWPNVQTPANHRFMSA
jgi:hypothetical protein